MRMLRDAGWVEPEDSYMAAKLRDAGFVLVGKTNTPELGSMTTTEPAAYGPSRNPWSLEHSTGGSSGGSAAAVAAGMTPVAEANDGGGSIRIPASACGLVGHLAAASARPSSPTCGPGASVRASSPGRYATRRRCRHGAGYMGDPFTAPLPARPYRDEVVAPGGSASAS
jgi:amidase